MKHSQSNYMRYGMFFLLTLIPTFGIVSMANASRIVWYEAVDQNGNAIDLDSKYQNFIERGSYSKLQTISPSSITSRSRPKSISYRVKRSSKSRVRRSVKKVASSSTSGRGFAKINNNSRSNRPFDSQRFAEINNNTTRFRKLNNFESSKFGAIQNYSRNNSRSFSNRNFATLGRSSSRHGR